MTTARQRATKLVPLIAAIGVTAFALTGCSAGGSSEGGTTAPDKFSYLSFAENTSIQDTLTALSTGECSAENEALPLDITTQPQASYDQQLQLLAGQDALPVLFASGNTPQVAKDLNTGGKLVDVEQALADLDKSDAIIPAAQSTIDALYDGEQYVLPTEFNVEGIWYNKQLFAENGIEVPTTWDELVAAAEKLNAAGVIPFSADGQDGWPLTRLVGNYIFRDLGPDALQKVADGEAKLTDPEYVKAAEAVADLGAKGYFGPSVTSIDYMTAMNQFLTGQAGMFYMGSWALANFNDPAQNQIGAENVGFIPFPTVEGGAGSADQLAANVGVPLALSKSTYSDDVASWLGCFADNFGSSSLQNQGVITGFKVNTPVEDLPPLTQEVQTQIDATTQSVLWFEALFNAKAATTSQTNASQLVTGAMSPEDFMKAVQADIGN
ncbi:raffinose/stachyose/melibiose transport system substrate-binding protein [Agromyces terreus]|uniref:Raffinose/stachyose/melibiose transport system substrate-binding protein n=1 Tax=Agromyces terreus TaxID=424795 RepID=A0A9X2GZ82_9MICO|nr:extracellular solute-binding protein [Agromyces terreus]MCP2371820.1 raffinose/stachyose/melibiose transport system substrate-binding protein [Agromyces terreus]